VEKQVNSGNSAKTDNPEPSPIDFYGREKIYFFLTTKNRIKVNQEACLPAGRRFSYREGAETKRLPSYKNRMMR